MTVVTLISDWGLGSHYIGAVKGTLLKLIQGVQIIDISHQIPSFNIMHASFVLRNAYMNFPEGTIHLVGINTEGGLDSPHIAIKHQGQYFIGADNGIFSLLFDHNPQEVVEIDILQDSDYFTFSTRDVFARAASMIASGRPLSELGPPHPQLKERILFKPVVHPDQIIGKIIFIDEYENVFVNIDQPTFRKVGKGRPFFINFRSVGTGIDRLSQSYADVVDGEKLALFGSTGFLEIAINRGKASGLLGLNLNETVSIDFYTEP
ncbi:MAG: SAM-dependent chlorinase/fluorinase [Bacteroidales bacterium]|jgi:S-adenosylmethionine hydrolase|nr:SAM-dependent chlorinase/fluorinase [Bacteroidales bacterium]NLM91372.1 SAM-dependent chlorinase/fluorinase [Bacteroidales bacterium]